MELLPVRLHPGDDLRRTLEALIRTTGQPSAFVISGIGSLVDARLRLADQANQALISGPLEIVSIAGSVTPDGAHLHMTVSDREGRVSGGHAGYGNIIRTTMEAPGPVACMVAEPGNECGNRVQGIGGSPSRSARVTPLETCRLQACPTTVVPNTLQHTVRLDQMTPSINMRDLRDAFDWAGGSGPFENRATVSRETGAIYWISDLADIEDQDIPDDIDDGELYLDVPPKQELNLGRQLVLRFVDEHLPQSYDLVAGYFTKAGAYARFKDLLDRHGKLDAWYKYEQDQTEHALREWANDNGLQIAPESEDGRDRHLPD